MSDSFADIIRPIFNQKKTHNKNSIYTVSVVDEIMHNGKKYVLVEASLIVNGIIPSTEFKIPVQKGMQISAIKISDQGNYILLSYLKAEKYLQGKVLYKAYLEHNSVEGKMISRENGIVKIDLGKGLFGNCTTEQENITNFYIISMPNNDKITLSVDKPEIKEYSIGQVVDIKIENISNNPYICSIDNNVIGILDSSDYSWQKKTPIVGQTMQAQIIDIINKDLVLNVKILTQNTWKDLEENVNKYIGAVHKGQITQIKEQGLVVQILGVEGFVVKYETSWNYYNENLEEKYKVGQEVDIKITKIDLENKKIYLSMREIEGNPFDKFAQKHKVGDIVEGKVLYDHNDGEKFANYTFVLLDGNVEALLQMSELSWSMKDRDREKQRLINAGSEIKVKIINIDEAKKKVSVSVKKISGESIRATIEKLVVGNLYDCNIVRMTDNGVQVKIAGTEVSGYIERVEIVGKITPGSVIKAKLMSVEKGNLLLSMNIAKPKDEFSMLLSESFF